MPITKHGKDIRSMREWFELAPPKKGKEHWVEGRSALECARAWCPADGTTEVPSEIVDLLASHPSTAAAVIRWATPEYPIRFDRFPGEPRNADMALLADHPDGPIAMTIEAKADEPFDELVSSILLEGAMKISRDESTNSIARVQQLARSLLPKPVPGTRLLGELRYQLLTGVAGTLAFAERASAQRAVFIVHEFVTDRTKDDKLAANAADLDAFIGRLTAGAVPAVRAGRLYGPFTVPGAPLFSDRTHLYVGKAVRWCRPH